MEITKKYEESHDKEFWILSSNVIDGKCELIETYNIIQAELKKIGVLI